MTNIKVTKNQGNIIKIECNGHSGYAEAGADIVCSAISSIMCSCHLGLVQVLGLKVQVETKQKQGFMKIELKKPDYANQNAQILLKTAELSLIEIAEDYSKFARIQQEVSNEVY